MVDEFKDAIRKYKNGASLQDARANINQFTLSGLGKKVKRHTKKNNRTYSNTC